MIEKEVMFYEWPEEKRADSGKEAQPYRVGFSDTGSFADLLDQFLPYDSGIYTVHEIRSGGKPEFYRFQ